MTHAQEFQSADVIQKTECMYRKLNHKMNPGQMIRMQDIVKKSMIIRFRLETCKNWASLSAFYYLREVARSRLAVLTSDTSIMVISSFQLLPSVLSRQCRRQPRRRQQQEEQQREQRQEEAEERGSWKFCVVFKKVGEIVREREKYH